MSNDIDNIIINAAAHLINILAEHEKISKRAKIHPYLRGRSEKGRFVKDYNMHHTGERYSRRFYLPPRMDEEQNSNDELGYQAGDNKEIVNRYLSEEIFSEDINFDNIMDSKSYQHYNDLEVRQARHEYLARLKSLKTLNQFQRPDSNNKNSNSECSDYRNVEKVCYILPTNMKSELQPRRPSAEILRKINSTLSPKSQPEIQAPNHQEMRNNEARDHMEFPSPFDETKSAPISQNNSEKIEDVEKSIQPQHYDGRLSTKGSSILKQSQKCRPEDVQVTYKNEAFKKVSSQTDTRDVFKVRSRGKMDNFSGTTFTHHKENSNGVTMYSPKMLPSDFPQPHESPSRRSMQTVQSKKYDDLIKLELSKCTIMSVIYDGLQKCEQSKFEVLPNNEKNVSNVITEQIHSKVETQPSPSISVGKLDTGSNTEIVTADLLSNVFKDIRDIHLQNILHAVKCIQYVENIPKKYGEKRGL